MNSQFTSRNDNSNIITNLKKQRYTQEQSFAQQATSFIEGIQVFISELDGQLSNIQEGQSNDQFENDDPFEHTIEIHGQLHKEMQIQTDDPRDDVVRNLLKSNKEICQSLKSLSKIAINAIDKLSIKKNKNDNGATLHNAQNISFNSSLINQDQNQNMSEQERDQLEKLDKYLEDSYSQIKLYKKDIERMKGYLSNYTEEDQQNDIKNQIMDCIRQKQQLMEKMNEYEHGVDTQQRRIVKKTQRDEQNQKNLDQLQQEIREVKNVYRELEKKQREEEKNGFNEFENYYRLSKELQKKKQEIQLQSISSGVASNNNNGGNMNSVIVSGTTINANGPSPLTTQSKSQNKTLVQNNSQPSINVVANNQPQINKNPLPFTNVEGGGVSTNVQTKRMLSPRVQEFIPLAHPDIRRKQREIKLQEKCKESQNKTLGMHARQKEQQYQNCLKQIQEIEKTIEQKSKENEIMSKECKSLQEYLDPALLKFLSSPSPDYKSSKQIYLQGDTNNQNQGLTIVRSYAQLKPKRTKYSYLNNLQSNAQLSNYYHYYDKQSQRQPYTQNKLTPLRASGKNSFVYQSQQFNLLNSNSNNKSGGVINMKYIGGNSGGILNNQDLAGNNNQSYQQQVSSLQSHISNKSLVNKSLNIHTNKNREKAFNNFNFVDNDEESDGKDIKEHIQLVKNQDAVKQVKNKDSKLEEKNQKLVLQKKGNGLSQLEEEIQEKSAIKKK